MRKNLKKLAAVLLTATMATGMLAGCGSNNSGSAAGSSEAAPASEAAGSESASSAATEAGGATGTTIDTSALAGQSITLLNSKGEIQTALEDLATTFTDETGINLEVMACGTGEVPYTKVTSMYQSGTAPTMAILDTTDVIGLAEEYGLDLSDQDWIQYCDNMTTKVNGKVYSFPFCVEGRGIIYSKKAIEDALGEEFDPSSINSLDSFKAICEKLRAAGISSEIFPDSAKMKKQMSYANAKCIAYVVLVGENEMNENKLTLKNMETGEQKLVSAEELLEIVK